MANEKRKRADGVAGALSSGVAIAATSMSSAGLADLPVIDSTNHAALTLFTTDANGRITKREVVYVTAHTASATSATIVKAQEGTTDQAWSTGDKWVHGATVSDISPGLIDYLTLTDGDATLTGTTTWANVSATKASVRDLVVAAQVNDLIEVGMHARLNTGIDVIWFDMHSIVSGSPVTSWATDAAATTGGPGLLLGWTSTQSFVSTTAIHRVTSSDLSSGTCTLRLRWRNNGNSSGSTQLYASTSGASFYYYARNLGPQMS